MSSPLFLTIYGVRSAITTESTQIRDWLSFDFARFNTEPFTSPADVSLSIHLQDPKSVAIPEIPETDHSPEYVRYCTKGLQYIDYYGQVLVVYDESKEAAQFYSLDNDILYEKIYLFIMSRVGEILDFKGLHRVHALGAVYKENGVLYLIPERGGKSTLALSLAKENDFKLLSDDTPLINSMGQLLPFPFRIAVRSGEEPKDVPSHFIRTFVRSKRGNKTLMHPDIFQDKWAESPAPCKVIFIGKWTKETNPSYRPISIFYLWRVLFRDCVIGMGLPQVVEYFIKASIVDVCKKIVLVASRSYAITRVALQSRGFEIYVTSDTPQNSAFFIKAVQEALSNGS